MTTKVLVTGASGQLGFDLVRVFRGSFEVVSCDREAMDITDWKKVEEVLRREKPDIILHAAAYTKTKEAESSPEETFRVNALGTYFLAHACASRGGIFVYISTDYVFGNEKTSYTENDTPHPLNVYGASKLAGEYMTKIGAPKHYIIRTNGLYGKHPSGKGYNFVTLMLKLAKEGKEIRVVNDEYATPTYTVDLAQKIKEIVEKKAPFGIYHVTNQGKTSWYEFAKEIFKFAGLTPDIKPISQNDRKESLWRPHSSVLINAALPRAGLALLRPREEALREYLDNI